MLIKVSKSNVISVREVYSILTVDFPGFSTDPHGGGHPGAVPVSIPTMHPPGGILAI